MISLTAVGQLLQAATVSLAIALLASFGGAIGGTLLALAHTSGNRLLSYPIAIFVTAIRGTPMLFQIMFLYLLLPQIGIFFSPFSTAVLAIGINSSAYVSQVIRSGIEAVDIGQIEAAKTLAISTWNIVTDIILPQALKVVLPALGNELVTLIKDTSLASLIGVHELYMQTTIIQSRTYEALPVYLSAGIIYLVMTTTLTLLFNWVEKRMRGYIRRS